MVGGGPKAATTTRRNALATAGVALVHSFTATSVSADDPGHEAIVRAAGDGYVAEYEPTGQTVYEGPDYLASIQAAVDSLPAGRTSPETVRVEADGATGAHDWDGDLKAVDLASYTIIDQRGTMTVDDTGEDLIVPYRGQGVESVGIAAATITGNPRYGIWLQSCSDVHLGSVSLSLYDTASVGLGIRIDDAAGGRSQNVRIDGVTVEGAQHHAVETYGVDGLDVGRVETVDTGGCGLLLNDSSNVSVGTVDATRADPGGGYAGFRCANGAGPNVTVDRVVAHDCGRGVFTVSGTEGVTVSSVELIDCGTGALLQDTRDSSIEGGVVADSDGEGVRIDSRSSDEHHHTRDVAIRHCRIEHSGSYGVRETGPDTGHNTVVDNTIYKNDGPDLAISAGTTVVERNGPSVETYASPGSDAVETEGLRRAVADWRADVIDTPLLTDVIDAWRGWA